MTKQDNSIFRILDAAFNRGREGLRVVEDYMRMEVGDAHLARLLKQMRHDLTQLSGQLDSQRLIEARDSAGDVGREIKTTTEYQRNGLGAVVQPNMARVQQSLRAIEEFGKTISPPFAQEAERLRYEAYTLEKAITTTLFNRQSLESVRLCVLVDGRGSADELANLAAQLVAANVGMIQLRDKKLTDRDLVVAGTRLGEVTTQSDTLWIMNDRTDLALAAGADGVHLGQDDIDISDARRILGAAKLVGVSCHTIEQARMAVIDGANYIGVGPTFPSKTKSFEQFAGLELVQAVAAEIQLPAFAIGGIQHRNVSKVLAAGLPRVAVRHAVINATDPFLAASDMNKMITSR